MDVLSAACRVLSAESGVFGANNDKSAICRPLALPSTQDFSLGQSHMAKFLRRLSKQGGGAIAPATPPSWGFGVAGALQTPSSPAVSITQCADGPQDFSPFLSFFTSGCQMFLVYDTSAFQHFGSDDMPLSATADPPFQNLARQARKLMDQMQKGYAGFYPSTNTWTPNVNLY